MSEVQFQRVLGDCTGGGVEDKESRLSHRTKPDAVCVVYLARICGRTQVRGTCRRAGRARGSCVVCMRPRRARPAPPRRARRAPRGVGFDAYLASPLYCVCVDGTRSPYRFAARALKNTDPHAQATPRTHGPRGVLPVHPCPCPPSMDHGRGRSRNANL